jgi:hypothetical protein
MRVGPDGRHVPQVVLALTQSRVMKADPERGTPAFTFRGGATLVVDLSVRAIKYRIVKNVNSAQREARTVEFRRDAAADPLRALVLAPEGGEPFAALHSLDG